MHALLKNLFFLCLGKQLYYEALTSQIFQKMRREKDIGINHLTRGKGVHSLRVLCWWMLIKLRFGKVILAYCHFVSGFTRVYEEYKWAPKTYCYGDYPAMD